MFKRIICILLTLCTLLPLCAVAENAQSSVQVGDIITYGHYEQDNVMSNGPEPIEWRVLDIQDGVAFLVSLYVLDCRKYHNRYVEITWPNCDLRRWLNNQFYKAAFSDEEKPAVILTHVDNSLAQSRPDWVQCEVKPSDDYVFLLSYAEADRYFKDDQDRQTYPTKYAKRRGSWDSAGFLIDGIHRPCWYWLRTMGYNARNTAVVIDSGILKNQHVVKPGFSVRPCINLDLAKAGY